MTRLLTRVLVASGLFFGCSVSPLGTCTATTNNCKNGAVCQLQNDPPVDALGRIGIARRRDAHA